MAQLLSLPEVARANETEIRTPAILLIFTKEFSGLHELLMVLPQVGYRLGTFPTTPDVLRTPLATESTWHDQEFDADTAIIPTDM